MVMIGCIWKYASNNDEFIVQPAKELNMTIARFVASMFMHINVEKDVY